MIKYIKDNVLRIEWEPEVKKYELEIYSNDGTILNKTIDIENYNQWTDGLENFYIEDRELYIYNVPIRLSKNVNLLFFIIDNNIEYYNKMLQVRNLFPDNETFRFIDISRYGKYYYVNPFNRDIYDFDIRNLSRNISKINLSLPTQVYPYALINTDYVLEEFQNLETEIQMVKIKMTKFDSTFLDQTIYFNNIDTIFWNNSSEEIRLDKEDFLSNETRIKGVFKGKTSIQNPVILLEYYSVPTFNYCYIKEFDRYYYIDEIANVNMNLWELTLRCDVLMSFKDKILNLDCKVNRQEFNYEPFIIDGDYPTTGKMEYEILQSVGQDLKPYRSSNLKLIRTMSNLSKCYVLNCAYTPKQYIRDIESLKPTYVDIEYKKPAITTGFMSTYFITMGQVQKFIDRLWEKSFPDGFSSLVSNPSEGIMSLYLTPFNIVEYDGYENDMVKQNYIKIGNNSINFGEKDSVAPEDVCLQLINSQSSYRLSGGSIKIDIINNFNDYYNSKVSLFIPLYGFLEISISSIYSYLDGSVGYIDLDYLIDFSNPMATFILSVRKENESRKITIYIGEVRVMFEIPLTHGNKAEIARNITNSIASTAVSVLSKGLVSFKTPSVTTTETSGGDTSTSIRHGKGGRITSVNKSQTPTVKTTTTAQGETKYRYSGKEVLASLPNELGGWTSSLLSNLFERISTGGSTQGWSMIDAGLTFFGILQKPELLDLPNYAHLIGRPSQFDGKLSELQGYTEVGACHMEGFDKAVPNEVNEIENILKTGVIL